MPEHNDDEEKNKEPDPMASEEFQSLMMKSVNGTQPAFAALDEKANDDQIARRKVEEENRRLKNQQVVDAMLRSVDSSLGEATDYQKQQISIEALKVVDTIVKGKEMPNLQGLIAAVQKGVITTQEKKSQDDGGKELEIEKRSTSRKSDENNPPSAIPGMRTADDIRGRIANLTA